MQRMTKRRKLVVLSNVNLTYCLKPLDFLSIRCFLGSLFPLMYDPSHPDADWSGYVPALPTKKRFEGPPCKWKQGRGSGAIKSSSHSWFWGLCLLIVIFVVEYSNIFSLTLFLYLFQTKAAILCNQDFVQPSYHLQCLITRRTSLLIIDAKQWHHPPSLLARSV